MSKTLGSLPNNAKVKYGSLFGHALVWLVADKNHSGYPNNSTTLVAEKIVRLACLDAKEASNSDGNRRNYGNNRYKDANIRQWLNSSAGAWYTAQHSADAPPTSANVWSNYNPYDTAAGFLNAWTQQERDALLSTSIAVGKATVDGGGVETITDKVFLLSCTEVGLTGDHVCGVKLAIFSDNNSRLAYPTQDCVTNSNYTNSSFAAGKPWWWWLRDAYASNSYYSRFVDAGGTLNYSVAYYGYVGVRPACNLSSSILVSDTTDADGCYTIIYNQPPTNPSGITVPTSVLGGSNLSVSWGTSTDPEGQAITYKLEQKVDGGTWAQIYSGTSRSYSAPVTYGWNKVQYRVKAVDAKGGESGYTTSAERTVTNNRAPTISGTDSALGSFSSAPPSYEYTVADVDGDQVTVNEYLDGVLKHTFTATLGQTNAVTITAADWREVLNGAHTIKITATDTKNATATRTLTFTKAVNQVIFEQVEAFDLDDMPTKATVNVQGSFPVGSTLKVEICNNGNDAVPTWENVTSKVQSNQKIYFANSAKTASTWGVKVRVTLQRGTATEPCYITSIGGNIG